MKLRRFTSAGVEMARQYLAAVKESGDVENVTLNGQPFTRAALISSPVSPGPPPCGRTKTALSRLLIRPHSHPLKSRPVPSVSSIPSALTRTGTGKAAGHA